MSLPAFFIDRPRFAIVLGIVVMIVGGLAYFGLPISQYPEVAPPTIVVTAAYPGATPETIAETVATPLEQEINGVDDMLYLSSQSTADGLMTLTVTFALGTDVDEAQVLVQNRVAVAEPRLPAEVRQIGVTTRKSSPDLLMVVHLLSPDSSLDQLYISNYAFLRIRDVLARIDGIGDVAVFGGSPYSMRVWLDPERLASFDLTAGDVVASLREQNVQVAAGAIGQQPLSGPSAFELKISSQGRLRDASEFAGIIVKSGEAGRLVRLEDVARIELGAQDYSVRSYLDGKNAVAMVLFQRPGSNALETADRVIATMDELSKDFPVGLQHTVVYNPTRYVSDSIDEVFRTLLIAIVLVVLTVFVFLQNWRTTIIPALAIPISLVGTFAIMNALDVSLNSLSLFGLVLAIGIVVDDAIVVVENVERLIGEGMRPLEATRQAMREVGSALIATTVVLVAVFVPTAFVPGLTGQFYRQFALTISASTVISTFVSLTLSPAIAARLLRARNEPRGLFGRIAHYATAWFFWLFNWSFDLASRLYASVVRGALRVSFLVLLVFAGLLGATWWAFRTVPTGFIPAQDQGYLIVALQLPDGASLDRTDAIVQEVTRIALDTPGISNAVAFAGFSGATRANSPETAAIFTALDDAAERAEIGRTAESVLADLRGRLSSINEALVFVIQPPPVPGIGTGGGFKMQIQDRGGEGYAALERAAWSLAGAANQSPGIAQAYTTFSVGTPQLYLDVDRTKARMLDVPISGVFEALQTYLGSTYVNDFNALGRIYRVTAQGESTFRDDESDVLRIRTRSQDGAIVPLGSIATLERRSGPSRVVRYNLYPAADLSGDSMPGFSTGQTLDELESLAAKTLPPSMGYEWTDLSYQARHAGGSPLLIFALCVLLAFLSLTAQYESWLLPLAVILIVPVCLLFGLAGVAARGLDNDVLVQVGFVVLVALACKNAILIVEFAKAKEDEGLDPAAAAVEACRIRLRPIMMTSLSFILGVLPLVLATGAGAEMRRSLGTAVFGGMIGVTFLGLLMTPVFYVVLRKLALSFGRRKNAAA
ncbi:MAG: multidrug efflux RND transporter permease subunit [Planctomycetota bacterium]